ncbi:MAG: mycothiol conjugate amidase Mca [Acidimicrobiales bacterium]
MSEALCLLAIHAHPDDEASKGAGTIARYHAEGVHTVLVTATGGEEGEILNPALDTDEVRQNIAEIRRRELDDAARAIGYDKVVLLGYRDSGMPESEANSNPRSLWRAPIEEAAGGLVRAIRTYRPQVVVTYPDEQNFYPHPDHLRVHDISLIAFDKAGDKEAYPEAGEPYQPLKLYYTVWQMEPMVLRHEKFLELGMESPYAEWFKDGPPADFPDYSPTAIIDVSDYYEQRRAGLVAHATQIDPDSLFWFGLPDSVDRQVWRTDAYVLARNLVGPIDPEDDLFAGVREREGAAAN